MLSGFTVPRIVLNIPSKQATKAQTFTQLTQELLHLPDRC